MVVSADPRIQQAEKIASAALERLRDDRIAPVPVNYAVWYGYYEKSDRHLVAAVEQAITSGSAITDGEIERLYEDHIGVTAQSKTLAETNRQIREAIRNLGVVLRDLGQDNEDYVAALTEFSGQLEGATGVQQLRRAVRAVAQQTRRMVDHHHSLGRQLASTAEQMAGMYRDIQDARRQALTDGLTGVSNRRGFDEDLAVAVEQATASRDPLCLVMIDIDHFKKLNDTFGHQVGDEVLRLVARVINDSVVQPHKTARYGGEEFAVILPETCLAAAVQVAERIRDKIAKRRIVKRSTGTNLGSVTVSAGAAELCAGEPCDALLERADSALYRAKQQGRNQVVVDVRAEGSGAAGGPSAPSAAASRASASPVSL